MQCGIKSKVYFCDWKSSSSLASCRKPQLLNGDLQAQRGLKPMQLVEETVEQMPGCAAEPMSSNIHLACCGMFNSNVRMGIKDGYLNGIKFNSVFRMDLDWERPVYNHAGRWNEMKKNGHILLCRFCTFIGMPGKNMLCIASFLRAACASQDQTVPKYITVSIPRSEKRSTHSGARCCRMQQWKTTHKSPKAPKSFSAIFVFSTSVSNRERWDHW